ncbi:hypothetical protein BUALT_Bualt06G0038100 [Buddleja alternifolia]|uniref:Uncharacterized protein n=1 Tax=Buddleja alternifolia TaxID=168488 RepID=A0AAV6XC51_9LAMI|nr:hypothetical protein BUALT_Bualt06G0038100 [Buddleja alternifolia]
MASESKLDPPETSFDLPPESFWVARDGEQDWFDCNAVMQRKMSLKLGHNRNFSSFSHRPDRKLLGRTSLFGLPKVQKSCGVDGNLLEKKPGRFLFRSRSEPGGKAMLQVPEPVSPRVSCTGRVGLKRCDGKKTGFSRLFSSLFGAGSGKNGTRKSRNGIVH